MSNGRDKEQSRKNRSCVRDVLMNTWDPIGVRGVPEASDEYDSYVGKVYVMLMDEQADMETLATYLFDTATGHIGLSPSDRLKTDSIRTAKELVSLRFQLGVA